MNPTSRLGTRGSALARWQTEYVAGLLRAAWPERSFDIAVITTRGDKVLDTPLPMVGGKGLFTAELEASLRSGEIDLAVHSLKDLPTDDAPGLTIGAIPRRADPRDVLISRNAYSLDNLPEHAVIGTSSTRRAAQIRYRRPDLRILDIRGNIDTRIRKAMADDSPYDAILLARAGMERLSIENIPAQILSVDRILPAPGQGALAVQCRDDTRLLDLLEPLNDPETEAAVTAERAFLAGLGGGCAVPIAAYATLDGPVWLHLVGRVNAPDGSAQIEVAARTSDCRIECARELGTDLARSALAQGADKLVKTAQNTD